MQKRWPCADVTNRQQQQQEEQKRMEKKKREKIGIITNLTETE